MLRWEDFPTYSARKLQNMAILPWSAKYTQPFFFRIRIVHFSYAKSWLVLAFSIHRNWIFLIFFWQIGPFYRGLQNTRWRHQWRHQRVGIMFFEKLNDVSFQKYILYMPLDTFFSPPKFASRAIWEIKNVNFAMCSLVARNSEFPIYVGVVVCVHSAAVSSNDCICRWIRASRCNDVILRFLTSQSLFPARLYKSSSCQARPYLWVGCGLFATPVWFVCSIAGCNRSVVIRANCVCTG